MLIYKKNIQTNIAKQILIQINNLIPLKKLNSWYICQNVTLLSL